MTLFGPGKEIFGKMPSDVDSDTLGGGYGLNINRYKRLMDDYGHRKRFRKVMSGMTIK